MAESRACQASHPIRLEEYTPPPYLIDQVDLEFDLGEEWTTVRSWMQVRPNPEVDQAGPLVLDSQALELVSVAKDGERLDPQHYTIGYESLRLPKMPEAFTLEIVTRIRPQDNTTLEGLYKSSGNFCTQCEPEGFRRITCFLDRPDVMACYTTTIIADAARYPLLLSNGNLIASGPLGTDRHWAKWQDPFPKPSYLFALFAGDLTEFADTFTTCSGREISLRMYVAHGNIDRCDHAMRSLKAAMAWDEINYGRECDLDTYQIVAVEDFNMGAMENKGLNIFNASAILAKPETATDDDFLHIEAIVAHEYFHNWSGNRVTCRDWFQLSLKEGFTVFREQAFSADRNSPAVQRINDVRRLRNAQFPEDEGPTAHPVRPESYIEISNFYTPTVYEKGAEVIRMLSQILGEGGFRRGTDLYFTRHDGQAVTTDAFLRAMEDANDRDLTQFRLWYTQAGTPRLHVQTAYDPVTGAYTLTFRQELPSTPGQGTKQPMHIPVAVGLLDQTGNELPLRLEGEGPWEGGSTRILELRKTEEIFRFVGLPTECLEGSECTPPGRPIPSLLRAFTAPVYLCHEPSDSELRFLLARDKDPFNRWEAGQKLALRTILRGLEQYRAGQEKTVKPEFVEEFRWALQKRCEDKALLAEVLTLPEETYLAELVEGRVDPVAIHEVREFVRCSLASALRMDLWSTYQANCEEGPYSIAPEAIARRSLKDLCLSYLISLKEPDEVELAREQFNQAQNMTDRLGALRALMHVGGPDCELALAEFYQRWHDDPQVVDKWFSIQTGCAASGTLERLRALLHHPAFTLENPNKVRAVLGTFAHTNPYQFHEESGTAYALIVDQILLLDSLNPQMAASLVRSLSRWRKFDEHRQALMKLQLERLAETQQLSKDVYEIATKSLKAS